MLPSSSAARAATATPAPSGGDARTEPSGTTVRLPDRLDFAAARDLHAELVELRGETVQIDGTGVVFAGGLAVQVLMSAARDWKAVGDRLPLTVSAAMQGDLVRLGVLGEFLDLVEVATC